MFTDPILDRSELSVVPALLRVARQIDRQAARDLSLDFGLTPAQWRTLAFACSNGPSVASDICAAFGCDRAEVSRAVAHLVELGLIERLSDPSHRQRWKIFPTDAGRDLFDCARAKWEGYLANLLQDISPRARQSLQGSLANITQRI